MKPIGVMSNLASEWIKKFAWLPVKSDITNRRIWLTTYWVYAIKIDNDGHVPVAARHWEMIYTREEYILKKIGV